MASAAERFQLSVIAGRTEDQDLPPTLASAAHPAQLLPTETPAAVGLDMSKDGRIAKSVSAPTGSSRIQKSVSIGGTTHYWHYRRLWAISASTLKVGAPNYDAVWYEQGPDMPFNEDGNSILAIVPFGQDLMLVGKATGSYIISNAADTRGTRFFQRGPMIQELALPAANQIIELDGIVYVSNAIGLFALNQEGRVAEVSRAIRGGVTSFANKALTCDYARKRIICGNTGVYEADTNKLFAYNGSTFSFTTRQYTMPDSSVMSVERVCFLIEHGDTTDGTLKYQARVEDDAYSAVATVSLPYSSENFTVVHEDLPASACQTGRRFQLRLTDLSANKYIRAIYVDSEAFSFDDFVR